MRRFARDQSPGTSTSAASRVARYGRNPVFRPPQALLTVTGVDPGRPVACAQLAGLGRWGPRHRNGRPTAEASEHLESEIQIESSRAPS